MRHRLVLTSIVLALGLSGCSGMLGDTFDKVSDLIPDGKKTLPGERKPVFPEGVPGVTPGVPPELVKGYQSPQTTAEMSPAIAEAAAEPGKKKQANTGEAEKPKPKPKKKVVAKPPQPAPSQAAGPDTPPAQPASAPWPGPQPTQSTAAWPAPQPSQPTAAWPEPAQSKPAAAAWPDPPAQRAQ